MVLWLPRCRRCKWRWYPFNFKAVRLEAHCGWRSCFFLQNCKNFNYKALKAVIIVVPFSPHKDVLEKLKTFHPLPGLILEWRRINNAITKVVFPLQREKRLNSALGMERIYPLSQTHTATGKEMHAKTSLLTDFFFFFFLCVCVGAAFLWGKVRKSSLCSTSTKWKYWNTYFTRICSKSLDVLK